MRALGIYWSHYISACAYQRTHLLQACYGKVKHLVDVLPVFLKGDNFSDFHQASIHRTLSKKGSILKRKVQILSFLSRSLVTRKTKFLAPLLPLQVNTFPLRAHFVRCLFAKNGWILLHLKLTVYQIVLPIKLHQPRATQNPSRERSCLINDLHYLS